MHMIPPKNSQVITANITWSRKKEYEDVINNGCQHDSTANFYLITAQWGGGNEKIIYLGKTYKQTVLARLNSRDHKERYESICGCKKNHKKYVRFGTLKIENGNNTATRVDEIEWMLIFSHYCGTMINKSKIKKIDISNNYIIKNNISSVLISEIHYGIFIKKRQTRK